MASALTFPRLMRYTESEPLAAKICRENCFAEAPKRILFLDDNSTLRDMLCETVLKDYNAEFVPCGTVTEARRILETQPIDAVLLDIRLGDGNGIDLYAALVKTRPELEVVFLTAWADTTHRALIEKIGPARVFAKERLAEFDFVERLLAQLHVSRRRQSAAPFQPGA